MRTCSLSSYMEFHPSTFKACLCEFPISRRILIIRRYSELCVNVSSCIITCRQRVSYSRQIFEQLCDSTSMNVCEIHQLLFSWMVRRVKASVYYRFIPFFPLNVCEIVCWVWVRQSLLVSQANAESCKSDISLPGGGPRRISGRFHLSHIAPWSTWLLLASPISLPFVPICAQRSVCLYIQRAGWERATVPQTWKNWLPMFPQWANSEHV